MAENKHRPVWDETEKKTKPVKKWKKFEQPNWYNEEETSKDSYRAAFKWGKLSLGKNPKEGLFNFCMEKFNLKPENLTEQRDIMGLEEIKFDEPSKLSKDQIKAFSDIVGADNVSEDSLTRVKVAYGKTMIDIMRLRDKIIENVPDLVVYPTTSDEIEKIVKFCNEQKIHIYVFGGGSSVTRGVEAMVSPAITLDMRKNFNKVLTFNEVDSTITVQAGMYGPILEDILNNAPSNFGVNEKYTCGHFPQSFVYSCVGGWVVTRGAGQNSTYYGPIADIVLGQKYVTPVGNIETDGIPRKATGPNMDQIMMGSEGAYGILTEVTLKIFKLSEKHNYFSFMFKSFEDAQAATREIMQGEFGLPSSFRISDEEETEMAMHLYGIVGTPLESLLKMFGYKDNKCLMLGFTDGEAKYQKNVVRNIKRIAKKYGAMSLTGYVAKSWEKGRFDDPYLRDTLQDHGMLIDTLECAVTWENMPHVHKYVRKFVKSHYGAMCTCHMSHMYSAGANLYFIFVLPSIGLDDFTEYHKGILNAIQESGAAMSHHHGIGKLFAPYNAKSLGKEQMDVLKALKNHFDPNNIMNPGGTLWLDK